MIKSFKIKFVLVLLLLVIPLGGVYAAQDDGVFTYVFHLYFDDGSLAKDRDFEFPFDLIAQEFQDSEVAPGSYYGEILSVNNKKLASFPISLPMGGKGVLSPMAPYFDNAKTANFYNPQNQKLLTIDLAPGGAVCNEDKICDADTGETQLNCSSDCLATVTPTITPPPDHMLDGVPWQAVWIILVVVIGIIILWWLRKRRKFSEVTPQV